MVARSNPAARRPQWVRRWGLDSPRALVLYLFAAVTLAHVERRTNGRVLWAAKTVFSRLTRTNMCSTAPDGTLRAPDVPRVSYSFSPAESAGLPDDAAFFASLPCPRSAYKVDAPRTFAAFLTGGGDACHDGAVIVSSFFDLGRAQWNGIFKRNTSTYFGDSRLVFMTLRNPMIVFTSPDLMQLVREYREENGVGDRTVVVGLAHACMPAAELYNRTAALMCAPTYLDGMLVTHHPEQRFPWYNIVMWSKIRWVAAVTRLPLLAGRYFYWLDAGCHYPVCRPPLHNATCLRPWAGTNSSRLRFAATEPLSHKLLGMTDAEWSQQKRLVLAGTIFGGAAAAMTRGEALFNAKVADLMDTWGIADQDQLVWSLVLREVPDAFEPYYTVGGERRRAQRRWGGECRAPPRHRASHPSVAPTRHPASHPSVAHRRVTERRTPPRHQASHPLATQSRTH